MQNQNGGGSGCLIMLACVVVFIIFIVIIGGSSSSSSSSSYTTTKSYSYGTKESYDSKYGQGSYDADKALLDSMRNEWNRQHGK